MLKITAIVSLMLIATWSQAHSRRYKKEATASQDFDPGSTLWAAGLSCDSCGSECASACGTRHFRSCCFNYLRRKRGPELGNGRVQLWPPAREIKETQNIKLPIIVVENLPSNAPSYPEPWIVPTDYKLRQIEDPPENRFQVLYDP